MPDPPDSWQGLFGNVGGQGRRFDAPLSPSDQYYGFLSKVDPTDSGYDVLFEVAPKEWFDNAIGSGQVDMRTRPPLAPASLLHIRDVAESAIVKRLGLRSADELAEGSWYLLTLKKGAGDISGDLYDPNLDMVSPT